MSEHSVDRRAFLAGLAGSVTVMRGASSVQQAAPPNPRRVRFSVIGVNHAHINSQTDAVLRGGGELVSVYAREPDLPPPVVKRFPQATQARKEPDVLECVNQLVLSEAIPDER